jgi:hypothetical protein
MSVDVKKILEEELEKKAKLAEEGNTSLINVDEDSDQNFIKLEDRLTEVVSEETSEVQSLVGKLKNIIFPAKKQQRDLDKEVGGLEAEEGKEVFGKDVWDDRSEEVDKMGSTDTFNTTGMKSVVWKQKRDRLTKKKHEKEHVKNAAEAAVMTNQNPQKGGISSLGTQGQSSFDNMSFTQRLKNLRQERSNDGNNNGGSGR